jgi:hypothetical protein
VPSCGAHELRVTYVVGNMQGGPAPDPWKEGSNNDKRKVNENKLLSKSKRQALRIRPTLIFEAYRSLQKSQL